MAYINMPEDVPFKSILFNPSYFNLRSMNRGSKFQHTQLAPTLWQASMKTSKLTQLQYDVLQQVFDSLRGGINLLKIYDYSRKYPAKYQFGLGGLTRSTGGAFDGTSTIANKVDANTITLSQLPISFTLSVGDYLGYYTNNGTNRYLHRVTAASTSDALGNMDVSVIPPVSMAFLTGVVVDLSKVHVYTLIGEDTTMPHRDIVNSEPFEFQAMQALRI